jgi:hypothetical protein
MSMLGIFPFALASNSGRDVLLLAAQYVIGLGSGAVLLTIMALAFGGLTHEEICRAGAAFSVVQRVGAPFGVTVIAVLLESALTRASSEPSGMTAAAMTAAFGSTFWWMFVFATVPLVLGFFLPKPAAAKSTK